MGLITIPMDLIGWQLELNSMTEILANNAWSSFFVALAAMFNAMEDVIQFRWHFSVFLKIRWKWLRDWLAGKDFIFPNNDGWHTLKRLRILCMFLAAGSANWSLNNLADLALMVTIYTISWVIIFNLFYDHFLIDRRSFIGRLFDFDKVYVLIKGLDLSKDDFEWLVDKIYQHFRRKNDATEFTISMPRNAVMRGMITNRGATISAVVWYEDKIDD